MKNSFKFILILNILSFNFLTTFSQEKIKWVKISELEDAIKNGKKDYFIFISIKNNANFLPDEYSNIELEHLYDEKFSFLKDTSVINYLNKNFVCFKFEPNDDDIIFQGIDYVNSEERFGRVHEFTNFLTSNIDVNYTAIVLRDKKFNLFEYKKSHSNMEVLKVLMNAEELKVNYIKSKLGEDNDQFKNSFNDLSRIKEKIKINKKREKELYKSVIKNYSKSSHLLSYLDFFISGSYKKIDLENHLKNKSK